MKSLQTFLVLLVYIKSAHSSVQCHSTPTCTCFPGSQVTEFHCEKNGTINQIVQTSEEKIFIRCQDGELDLEVSPNVSVNAVKKLQLRNCSLPQRNFKEILNQFSVEDIEVLQFESSKNITLLKSHFDGLGKLERLKLNVLTFVSLANDVFEGVPNLHALHLERNKNLKLEKHIFRSLKHLKYLYLENNNLDNIPDHLFDQLEHLNNLQLWNNRLKIIHELTFSGLSNLTTLLLMNNEIETISEKAFDTLTNLSTLDLSTNKLSSLPSSLFQYNKQLKVVRLKSNQNLSLTNFLFANLPFLKKVDLTNCSLESIPGQIFENSTNLEVLQLGLNKLVQVPVLHFLNLKVLNLERNSIQKITKLLPSLEEINLASNQVNLVEFGSFSGNLIKIYMSHNQYSGEVGWILDGTPRVKLLDLSYNYLTKLDDVFSKNLTQLEILDLRHNRVNEVSFLSDSKTYIKLDYNNITEVNFDPKRMKSVSLTSNPLICNCKNYKFYQHVKFSGVKKVTCKAMGNKYNIPHLAPSFFTCHINKTIEDCVSFWRPWDKAIVINCTNKGLTKFPQIDIFLTTPYEFNQTHVYLESNNLTKGPSYQDGYENITQLYLSRNKIQEISWLPPNLQILALDHNHLHHLDDKILKRFKKSRLDVTLGHNLWMCDCDNLLFVNFLQSMPNLTDLNNIYCANKPRTRLINLKDQDLCFHWHNIHTAIIMVSILLFFVVLTAFYYAYTHKIRLLCFIFGCCQDRDSDMVYDAFISYSHQDEIFITQHLLPKLESGPKPYRLCVHFRDWIPGELITTQIRNSVEESRKTVIILSQNFMESVWGKMEFRVAHTEAMTTGRNQVVVVLYGDVDVEMLDPELRTYLRINTYLKWGDLYFWDKLKYALNQASL